MSTIKDFAIDKVSWHTSVKGNSETPERVKLRFRIFTDFLQENKLTKRELLPAGELPSDDYSIRVSDLTEEGFEVIKLGYDKWLKRISIKDRDATNTKILFNALKKVRGE